MLRKSQIIHLAVAASLIGGTVIAAGAQTEPPKSDDEVRCAEGVTAGDDTNVDVDLLAASELAPAVIQSVVDGDEDRPFAARRDRVQKDLAKAQARLQACQRVDDTPGQDVVVDDTTPGMESTLGVQDDVRIIYSGGYRLARTYTQRAKLTARYALLVDAAAALNQEHARRYGIANADRWAQSRAAVADGPGCGAEHNGVRARTVYFNGFYNVYGAARCR